jgi:hypothetical protein
MLFRFPFSLSLFLLLASFDDDTMLLIQYNSNG